MVCEEIDHCPANNNLPGDKRLYSHDNVSKNPRYYFPLIFKIYGFYKWTAIIYYIHHVMKKDNTIQICKRNKGNE